MANTQKFKLLTAKKHIAALVTGLVLLGILFILLNATEAEVEQPSRNEQINCTPFKEAVVWSSGYSYEPEGALSYKTWFPRHSCAEIRKPDCFLGNVSLQTRMLSFPEGNETGEGFIQIAALNESLCDTPEKATYSRYLAYGTLHGEDERREAQCGSNKNPDGTCGIETADRINAPCYGIKAQATKDFIIDGYELNYSLCWAEHE